MKREVQLTVAPLQKACAAVVSQDGGRCKTKILLDGSTPFCTDHRGRDPVSAANPKPTVIIIKMRLPREIVVQAQAGLPSSLLFDESRFRPDKPSRPTRVFWYDKEPRVRLVGTMSLLADLKEADYRFLGLGGRSSDPNTMIVAYTFYQFSERQVPAKMKALLQTCWGFAEVTAHARQFCQGAMEMIAEVGLSSPREDGPANGQLRFKLGIPGLWYLE